MALDPDAWAAVQRAEAHLDRVLYRALSALAACQGSRATWKTAASALLPGAPA
jgi:hypothetical protein